VKVVEVVVDDEVVVEEVVVLDEVVESRRSREKNAKNTT
jgi:hypothetical protein